jgi:transcriptional regulator with XRE-family HTH domain
VIRHLRRTRGLTIEALACDADMDASYLSGIERGERNPTWNKLNSLARALSVPVSGIARRAEVENQTARD